jgi:hypothetical protein
MDVAVPSDRNVTQKEVEKKIGVPVVTGAMEIVSKCPRECL